MPPHQRVFTEQHASGIYCAGCKLHEGVQIPIERIDVEEILEDEAKRWCGFVK